jgi:acetone carboxylase gamma subunit
MENNEKITIDNEVYEYSKFYDRLQIINDDSNKPGIICPKCLNTLFTITYGDYKCIANCKCGHSMTVYDG